MGEAVLPTARIRVDISPKVSIGPGKIALLKGIARTGSLSAAAREIGMSYRRGWVLIHSINESFRVDSVVFSTGGKAGGGAKLTPFGQKLIDAFTQLETASDRMARDCFAEITTKLSEPRTKAIMRRRISKSSA
jgi:molybdate transport system regulatory protein